MRLPILGLGCAPVGRLTRAGEAGTVIERAYRAGIRFFDTAPRYGAGRSESHLGRILPAKPRGDFILSTKVGWRVETHGENTRLDFTYDGIMRGVEESLRRLRLNRVDILHIHDPNAQAQLTFGDAYRALDSLRAQKVIRGVGIGVGKGRERWELGQELMRRGRYDCFLLAGRYSLLHQEGLAFINRCRREGVGIILGGVYHSGILATGDVPQATYFYRSAPAAIRRRVAVLEVLCREFAVSLPAAALRFALMHPGVTSALIGMEETAQIEDNLAHLEASIPEEFWTRLRERKVLDAQAPTASWPTGA